MVGEAKSGTHLAAANQASIFFLFFGAHHYFGRNVAKIPPNSGVSSKKKRGSTPDLLRLLRHFRPKSSSCYSSLPKCFHLPGQTFKYRSSSYAG